MNVLSLFDGMSCGMIALERARINVDKYYASEIDKNAEKVSKDNYPNIIRVGDVTKWREWDIDWSSIDLLIGGSPCQDFSVANTYGDKPHDAAYGLSGAKSSLFYEYLAILTHLRKFKPNINFLLENVKMKKSSECELNNYLGITGVHINSELVSFQKRSRIYWSNIEFVAPKDKFINFQDYKDTNFDYCDEFKTNKTASRIRMWNDGKGNNSMGSCANVTNAEKVYCLTTKQDRCPNSGLIQHGDFCRYMTRSELELAQTVPIGYTKSISNNQAQAVLGNGWTVDVIAHIFKSINKE